ncbi:hypothetical protein ZWY2020_011954 [Hordeum vulgare]|nr:hypothetical protein ZWY2020_011954 [Hordeum vulgare]
MKGHHLPRSLYSSCYPSSFSFRRQLLPLKLAAAPPFRPMFRDPLLHCLTSVEGVGFEQVLDNAVAPLLPPPPIRLLYLWPRCRGLYLVSASPPRNSPSEIVGLLGWRFLTYAVVGKSSALLGSHHCASRGAATVASCSC